MTVSQLNNNQVNQAALELMRRLAVEVEPTRQHAMTLAMWYLRTARKDSLPFNPALLSTMRNLVESLANQEDQEEAATFLMPDRQELPGWAISKESPSQRTYNLVAILWANLDDQTPLLTEPGTGHLM